MILCLTVWGTTTVFSRCTISHPHYQLCKGFINTYCGLIFLLEVILADVRWTSLPFSAGSRTRLTGNKWAVPRWKARSLGLEHHHLPEIWKQGSHQSRLSHQKGSRSPADPAYSKLEAHAEPVSEGVTQHAHSLPLPPTSPLRNQKSLQAFKQRDLTDGLNFSLWQKR